MSEKQKTLADYAISYKMSSAPFNPMKTMKEVREATAKEFGCGEKRTTGSVYLLEEQFTEPLVEQVRRIRKFFETYTLKLGKIDLIPSHNFWRVSEFVQTTVPVFDALKADFVDRWEDEIMPQSKASLVKLGKILEDRHAKIFRMRKEEVAERIYFDFSKSPMADPSALKNLQGVSDDLRKSLQEEIIDEYKVIEQDAHTMLASRLRTVLSKFVGKMKTYKGDGNRMHGTIISNIGELVDMIPDMLVGDNPDLIAVCNEAKLLTNWDVDILKENESARVEACRSAEDILNKMKF
jgi:hypothetical protein